MLVAVDAAVVLKEQGNAPERRKSDQSVYYTADRCCLSAAYPSHDVEANSPILPQLIPPMMLRIRAIRSMTIIFNTSFRI